MKFRPKKNNILTALEKGEIPLGTQVYTSNPSIIEILGYTGFDFYKLDMEHTRIDFETMEHCIRAADAVGITTVVKVPDNDPTLIRYSVEAGAQGVIVPHIKTKEDVKKAINSLRYPPEGELGTCPSIRSACYSTAEWDSYLANHSSQTMLIPVLEDKEALDNVEEIFEQLKVGVDAVSFGRADFAQSLTEPGEKVNWNNPRVSEAFDKVLEVSKKTGIPTMVTPWPKSNAENVKAAVDKGAKICQYSIDQVIFQEACLNIVQEIKAIQINS